MKDLYKFSLADEEEEYYDDEEEYDEEEYDDEAYDDEEYDDEDYGDEYEDDEYGENYPAETGEDTVGKILDEIASIRRSVGMPAQNMPSGYHAPLTADPVFPYVISTGVKQNNNDNLIFNEISRLREELSKTQTTQAMHIELGRLKDSMERDARQNESRLKDEIRRLTERIEELSK
ncbi:MAG: hypothetical protein FWH03_04925 [Firmicutes bacterium]|nr:hypothetical protein [Bacillota bacterium]